jgi:hypothetical protein
VPSTGWKPGAQIAVYAKRGDWLDVNSVGHIGAPLETLTADSAGNVNPTASGPLWVLGETPQGERVARALTVSGSGLGVVGHRSSAEANVHAQADIRGGAIDGKYRRSLQTRAPQRGEVGGPPVELHPSYRDRLE